MQLQDTMRKNFHGLGRQEQRQQMRPNLRLRPNSAITLDTLPSRHEALE